MLLSDATIPDKFAKYVLPVLALLIPGAVTAASKWILDHSHQRRSAELTERVSTLAKSIAELPVLPLPSVNPAVTPQSALTVELEAALHELTCLGFASMLLRVFALLHLCPLRRLCRGRPVESRGHRRHAIGHCFQIGFLFYRVWHPRNSAADHSPLRGKDPPQTMCAGTSHRTRKMTMRFDMLISMD